MSKIPFHLLALLACLLVPPPVEATCGQCYTAHACTGLSTFQVCYNGVRDESITYSCPGDRPVCTAFGIICMAEGAPRACGDVSQCESCGANDIYTCTSLNTFGKCSDGAVTAGRATCPEGNVCSVAGAAAGTPCISRCGSSFDDICDRVTDSGGENETTTTTTGDSSGTSTEPSTSTSPGSSDTSPGGTNEPPISTDEPPTDLPISTDEPPTTSTEEPETQVCENGPTGRFAFPGDTVCTSYIFCNRKGDTWIGTILECPSANPFFNATLTYCVPERPTGPGCV
ncbi:uncharacterized protein LOC115622493 [Scaptodrosophila lebanonensis]|uniref:Uncharacterized protein LOC115622493 n=1 Tax=Drosophila lebanonensis TaxID=7225 RepID=A0A6J2T8H6_DROLE|nr:uncharacterized protein LOC115622493 [Scaptodrosophila lebanonensis]